MANVRVSVISKTVSKGRPWLILTQTYPWLAI